MTILRFLLLVGLIATFTVVNGKEDRLGSLGRRTKGKKAKGKKDGKKTDGKGSKGKKAKGGSVSDPVDRTGNSFQVKMYWEEGYLWQEETFDRRWCWECRGGCVDGNEVFINECDPNVAEQYFELGYSNGDADQIVAHNSDVCLSHVVGTREIELRTCDLNSPSQLWTGFRTDGIKFELSPDGADTGCVANYWHHPKAEELIYVATCSVAQNSKTSYLIVI